ncbi:putative Ig domain-containing protein [Micromonospora radicis]|uniref:LPXTG cell wall anchor domain-containing protein n=1 Tax=Micromonospora radicis TaxID=1894971 RepID=A0A418MZD8_9ACTN|nr:putative Ig domain-containing protein [Micromonospora radicis]RIV40620.1 LPXTG cell wall anchor domain-containing protein [Micromonospora radicis]
MKTLRPITIVSVLTMLLLGTAAPVAAEPAAVDPVIPDPVIVDPAVVTISVTSDPPPSEVTAYEPYPGHTFTATGDDEIRFSLIAGAIPPGLALSSSGTLTGTPTVAARFAFTVRATGSPSGESADHQVTVVVVPPVVTVTSPEPVSPWYVGQVYPTHRLTVSGGTAPHTVALGSGALPPGLSISPVGVLAGSPNQAGRYRFALLVTDANGFQGQQDVTLVIATAAAIVTSGEPPRGTAGQAYSFRFTAEGDSDIRFGLAAGALPDGLVLDPDGVLSGTPTVAGTFDFTVRATGTATSDTAEVSLVVYPDPTATPSVSPTPTAQPTAYPTAPSESPTPTTAAPSPSRTTGAWLPVTGENSALVLMLLGVVAFSIGGILLVVAYRRRQGFSAG